jgi:hypothetical protein
MFYEGPWENAYISNAILQTTLPLVLICYIHISEGDTCLHIIQISTSTIYVTQICRTSLWMNEGACRFTTFSGYRLVVIPYHQSYYVTLKAPTNVTHVATLLTFQMTALCQLATSWQYELFFIPTLFRRFTYVTCTITLLLHCTYIFY